jgi:hypothetical protein
MSLEAKRKAEIEKLRELEKKAFGPRHGKTDFYEYLDGVLELYFKWKAAGKSQTRAKQLASIYEFKLRKSTHPIRAIIDASSEQDSVVRSRWTRALQFALKHGSQVEKIGLGKFLESNGGVGGCASKAAQHNPRRQKVVAKPTALGRGTRS